MDIVDFVPYDTAKKLKAEGFDVPCRCCYTTENAPKGSIWEASGNKSANYNKSVREISAPTLWQAAKWLREECGLHINVCPFSDCSEDADGNICDKWDFWGFDIYVVTGGKRLTDDDGEYDSYEAALPHRQGFGKRHMEQQPLGVCLRI